MNKAILGIAPLLATLAAMNAPASAQAPSAVVIFGDDTCPAGNICVRAPENERYRIPQALRGESGAALAARMGDRINQVEYAGASGVQSCSPVGSGGASGCFSQMMRARDEDNRRDRESVADSALPQ